MSLLDMLKAGGRKAKAAYDENRREVAEEETLYQEHYKKGRKKYLEKAGYEAGLGKSKGGGGLLGGLGSYAPGGGSVLDRVGGGIHSMSQGAGRFGGFGEERRPQPKRRHHKEAKRRRRR